MANGEVVLVNKSRRPHTIVLDHEAFRSKRYGFKIGSMEVADHGADGSVNRRSIRRATPGSVRLLPGESSPPLHAAAEKLSQVAALLARGELAIEAAPEDKSEGKADKANPSQADQRDGTLGRQRVRIEKSEKGSDK